ncbi:MAG: Electron transfer flavoprotein alpha/beta-subunit [Conexibacter sp.]|nr:Electron transfer flavoprotein alpha/beta-subunit [Conexibacter sp.]
MKIVVSMKCAATLEEDYELAETEVVSDDALEWDVNEWDTYALEAALQIKESEGDGEIVVVTVGGDEVADALLTCLAMGADRAVHVDVGEGAGLDALSVARLLSEVIRPEAADLVLCGVQSSDGSTAATGVALAELLDLPRVAVVREIACEGTTSATVHRELEGGLVEVLRVSLPALVTVQTGINEPRYANLRGIRQAKEKPRRTLTPEDLGLSPEELAGTTGCRRQQLSTPVICGSVEFLDGSTVDIAEKIAHIIRQRVAA